MLVMKLRTVSPSRSPLNLPGKGKRTLSAIDTIGAAFKPETSLVNLEIYLTMASHVAWSMVTCYVELVMLTCHVIYLHAKKSKPSRF